ncbi:arylamine N-acetyltransferase [Marinobacter caseinilyticus]|uniref:arylamine N-acetyltransferase n=1 Tax=Marinobacter caseinilyticus TaxID=2692195 RepID=UPI00140B18B0|nr:arylamine N-acetyltransferase [Marinobacter caseinilyticus]
MNAVCQYDRNTPEPPPRAQRKDILALEQGSVSGPHTPQRVARQLRAMGFTVTLLGPEHWQLSRSHQLLRVDLYSTAELAAFAQGRAASYACDSIGAPKTTISEEETQYDTLPIVPG